MSLPPLTFSASSTLDDDDACGPLALLTAGDDDACWRSGGGGSQWLSMHFAEPVAVRALELIFQGGFVGTPLDVDADVGSANDAAWSRVASFATADSNEAQRFELPTVARGVRALRLGFPASTDFFGRVIVYRVRAFGE